MILDVLRKVIFGKINDIIEYKFELVILRLLSFCVGCLYRGFFYEFGKRKNLIVGGDIGCYIFGFVFLYNGIDYVVCMGFVFGIVYGV